MKITMRQAHAQLREMGIFNIAESTIEEEDEATVKRWRRPSEVVSIDDPIIQKLKRRFWLPQSQVETFFRKASEKPGGPPQAGLTAPALLYYESEHPGFPLQLPI